MKKISLVIGFILFGALIWYLFIKPYDYLVTFKAKTFPGTINQTIKIWGNTLDGFESLEQEDLAHLNQKILFNDSVHVYNWKIDPINDSLSNVKVYIKDKDHSLRNKITIPFSDTDFEKRSRKTLLDFNNKLNEHLEKFKVTIVGEAELTPKYCAFVALKTSQFGKASGMMQNYSFLSTMMLKNEIPLDGTPFIEITNWDMAKDSINYNFCFPIKKMDSLPKILNIKYKEIKGTKALKAIYNGNYITSDRAWYALLDYANQNNISVINQPVEIFYNNPNMGGDELNWKAEIYMPLKD